MFIKAMRFPGLMMPVLIMTFLVLLFGCSTGGLTDVPASSSSVGTSGGTTGGTTPATAIGLGTDASAVKSDDSNKATVTATALDVNSAVIVGIDVAFSASCDPLSASCGTLSASSVKTNADGKAVITFSSGTLDQSNRVITITATASGKTAQIPGQVVGSTLTMTSTTANLPSDGGSVTATLSVIARNAGNVPVRNVAVTLTVSGAGNVTLSAASGTTDINGKLRDAAGNEVTVTGTRAGIVTVKAQGLGTTATLDYTVTGPAAAVVAITVPADDPHALATNTDLTVTVSAPAPTTAVQFATTLGTWDGGASSIVTKAVVAGTASAVFKSIQAGLAAVQVSDATNPSLTDTVSIAVSAPASAAGQVTLQPSASVVAPSSTTIKNTVTLTATVRTAGTGNQVVGSAAIAFSIQNPTGGGETISPVVAYTNSSGVATATFTSGSLSTGQSSSSLTVKASVLDGTNPTAATNIVIGGTAGSVVIGYVRTLSTPTDSPSTYRMPMSVLVADTNGNPRPGATVTLNLWPVQFSAGMWYNNLPPGSIGVDYTSYIIGTFNNNDLNENTILDAGEDVYGNGRLTPPNSAAGTLPSTVVTDENGVANFYITYLKSSADWIVARVRASTLVFGTETSSSVTFRLPYVLTEAETGLVLPDSTFAIPLTIGTAIGSTISYTFPPLSPPDTLTPTSSTATETKTVVGYTYTFTSTKVRSVGDVIDDYVTVQGTFTILTGTTTGLVPFTIPIRIIVK